MKKNKQDKIQKPKVDLRLQTSKLFVSDVDYATDPDAHDKIKRLIRKNFCAIFQSELGKGENRSYDNYLTECIISNFADIAIILVNDENTIHTARNIIITAAAVQNCNSTHKTNKKCVVFDISNINTSDDFLEKLNGKLRSIVSRENELQMERFFEQRIEVIKITDKSINALGVSSDGMLVNNNA